MFLSFNFKVILKITVITFIFISLTEFSLSQTSESAKSPYNFSVFGGYTGLFKDSKLAETSTNSGIINGLSVGFSFEYNLPRTNSYLQLLTENNEMKFKTTSGDKTQNYRFSSIGLKMYPSIINDLYLTVGTGLMTNKDTETQMIMSLNVGYDIIKSKNSISFIQIGLTSTDFQDNFITFRFGIRINL